MSGPGAASGPAQGPAQAFVGVFLRSADTRFRPGRWTLRGRRQLARVGILVDSVEALRSHLPLDACPAAPLNTIPRLATAAGDPRQAAKTIEEVMR